MLTPHAPAATPQDRQIWKPGTMVYPAPAALVTCGDATASNLLTIAWTGTICTDPAMLYISVRPQRHSYDIIRSHMEFTLNLTTEPIARATDWCGVRSGAEYDKWAHTALTPKPGIAVACPYVDESPLAIECRVRDIVPLGSHHMFIAEVLDILAKTDLLDPDTGTFRLDKAGLISYAHGHYYAQGAPIGRFGFSVKKKP